MKWITESLTEINTPEADYLYTAGSQIQNAGAGLFTAIRIYQAEVIAVFRGKIITAAQLNMNAPVKNDAYFINMPDGTIMDCLHSKCLAKYANDAEGFYKTKFKNNAMITLDIDDRVCIVALHDIHAGNEIFCSYGKQYWVNFRKHLSGALAS